MGLGGDRWRWVGIGGGGGVGGEGSLAMGDYDEAITAVGIIWGRGNYAR